MPSREGCVIRLMSIHARQHLRSLPQVRAVMDSEYIPNFKTAFQHFLVHTGGRAVIEEVEKKLSLAPADVQPSKETLFRYGNTCCAAVFYVLTNMEARVRACAAPLSCWELSVLVCSVCRWSSACLFAQVFAGALLAGGIVWCTRCRAGLELK